MPTLLEFIVAQSSLPVGNTVRDHIENPSEGGSGSGGFVLAETVDVEVDTMGCIDIEVENSTIDVEIEPDINVEIENQDIDVEVECYEYN